MSVVCGVSWRQKPHQATTGPLCDIRSNTQEKKIETRPSDEESVE